MPRPVVAVASLVTFGALAGLAYIHASRISSDPDETTPRSSLQTAAPDTPRIDERAESSSAAMPAAEEEDPTASANQTESTQPAAADDVAQWVADSRSNDAKTRAAAIAALATAPKAQAVPALEYVLESGEPQVDRQIALRSLHTLAVNDGDSNGAIRDVMRKAMYHSDDEAVTQTAQALLEDIEAEFAQRAHDAAKSPPGDDAAKSPPGDDAAKSPPGENAQ